MTLLHPWALVLLLAVPVVWWWHRRRRRPVTVEIPSLLFLEEEMQVRPVRRRAFDAELACAVAAALPSKSGMYSPKSRWNRESGLAILTSSAQTAARACDLSMRCTSVWG